MPIWVSLSGYLQYSIGLNLFSAPLWLKLIITG